jgi:hypothetical protein
MNCLAWARRQTEQYNLSNEELWADKKCEASFSSIQTMIINNWATTPVLVIPGMSVWTGMVE